MCGGNIAIGKCRLYLLGLGNFTLMVDHQALVSILDRYTLDAVENSKLQRLKERLSPYVFTTLWRKGKDHAVPDALSRTPVQDPSEEDTLAGADALDASRSAVICHVCAIDEDDGDSGGTAPLGIDPLLA